MARRTYSAIDQARAAVVLKANGGNVKRTARELGFPSMTVRDWKIRWEQEGYPDPVEEALPAVAEDVSGDMEQARSLAVDLVIRELRAGNVKAKEAAWIASVFTDKINLIRGLATSRNETVAISLPDTKELAKELAAYVARQVEAAQTRADEIEYAEDAEWTSKPKPALEPANR